MKTVNASRPTESTTDWFLYALLIFLLTVCTIMWPYYAKGIFFR